MFKKNKEYIIEKDKYILYFNQEVFQMIRFPNETFSK